MVELLQKMPLAPGERYASLEVDIMKQLGSTVHRLELYEALRKTETNPNILLAVGGINMHDFELLSEHNQIEPYKDHFTMDDIQAVNRNLDGEEELYATLSEGGIRYGLGYVVQYQNYIHKLETFVFDLNTCEIHDSKVDSDNFQKFQLMENFNLLVRNNRPTDIFKKKFLMFPVWHRGEAYCTLIVNPLGAVKLCFERMGDTCKMVHIATKKLTTYKKEVVPRIIKLLFFFMELYRPEERYERIQNDKIVEQEKRLPEVASCEKPFMLLHIFHYFFHREFSIRNWEAALATIGENRKKMSEMMKDLRKQIGTKMYVDIMMGPNKIAIHLLEKRRLIGEHQEKQKTLKIKEEVSDCGSEPPEKIKKIDVIDLTKDD